jgi:hypothetical protein
MNDRSNLVLITVFNVRNYIPIYGKQGCHLAAFGNIRPIFALWDG